jgi:hypothetical protein
MKCQKILRHSSQLKNLIAPVALLAGLAICSLSLAGSTSSIGNTSLQGEAALRSLKEEGLYDSLREAMAAARYNLHEARDRLGVWRGGNVVAAGSLQISLVAPALFSANADGQGVAAASALRVRQDGSQVYEPVARFIELSASRCRVVTDHCYYRGCT